MDRRDHGHAGLLWETLNSEIMDIATAEEYDRETMDRVIMEDCTVRPWTWLQSQELMNIERPWASITEERQLTVRPWIGHGYYDNEVMGRDSIAVYPILQYTTIKPVVVQILWWIMERVTRYRGSPWTETVLAGRHPAQTEHRGTMDVERLGSCRGQDGYGKENNKPEKPRAKRAGQSKEGVGE